MPDRQKCWQRQKPWGTWHKES